MLDITILIIVFFILVKISDESNPLSLPTPLIGVGKIIMSDTY